MFKKVLVFFFCLCSIILQAQQLDHVLGEVILQLHPKITQPTKVLQAYTLVEGKPSKIAIKRCLNEALNIWLVQFDFAAVNEQKLLRALRANKLVQLAQFNHLLEERAIPDDPQFSNQWNFLNTGERNGVADADIDMEKAWDITTGGLTPNGDTIVIAVLDDGIDLEHEDLKANIWKNYQEIPNNGIDDDGNGYVDDFRGWNVRSDSDRVLHSQVNGATGHGTFVSGVIGAVGNNGIGIAGVNWDIKIMTITPFGIVIDEASIIAGYGYALEMRKLYNDSNGEKGAFVVATNSSWGVSNLFEKDAPIWCDFYNFLGQVGIINTVATTNRLIDIDANGDLPTVCSSDYIIGVTNSTRTDALASAGFGAMAIDLAAPGEDILVLAQNNNYKIENGSSFSAPMVAGVIGLLYAAPCENFNELVKKNPSAAAILAKEYILEGVDARPAFATTTLSGGRLNAFNSLELLLGDCGDCPPILGVDFSAILEEELTLNWVVDNTIGTSIRYRPLGQSTWTTLNNLQAPYQLTNLTYCSNYELQFAPECEGEPLVYSDVYLVKTEGCCEPPSTIESSGLTSSTLNIEWEAVATVDGYEVHFKEQEMDAVIIIETTENNFSWNNLMSCTTYEIQIKPLCSNKNTVLSDIFTFKTKGCGVCTDVSYCDARSNTSFDEWIARVAINTLVNETGQDNTYGDYTGLSTTLETFTTYDISLSPGFSTQAFSEYFKVWIDYNQDGQFDNVTEVAYDPSRSTLNRITGQITIPPSAELGLTRMRVAMKATQANTDLPPTPCENFEFGEVEDYCVTITEGTFRCLPPQSNQVTDIGNTTATFNWEGDAAVDYILEYKLNTENTWTEVSISGSESQLVIESLLSCKAYEFRIAQLCGSTLSDYSTSISFKTNCDCIAPSNLLIEQLDSTSLSIQWDPVGAAESYEIFFAALDASISPIFRQEATTQLLFTDLPPCKEFDLMITATCLQENGGFIETRLATSCGGTVGFAPVPTVITNYQVYPNPFANHLTLSLELKESTTINLTLFTISGQVLSQESRALNSGENRVEVVASELLDGIYILEIATEDGRIMERVVKINNE